MFKRAKINAAGDIELSPGRYFVDGNEGKIMQYLPEILRTFGGSVDMVKQLRGAANQIMVEVLVKNAVTVPRTLAQYTGHFWALPAGVSLEAASDQLYGPGARQSQDFWDYLAVEWPGVFAALQSAAQTAEAVTRPLRRGVELGTGLAVAVALVAVAAVVISSASSGRRSGNG